MDNNEQDIRLPGNKYIPTSEFYSLVIDSLQDYAIFSMDKKLLINCWLAGSTKIFGYEPEEVMGKHFEIIFTEEDKKNEIPQFEVDNARTKGRASDNKWHVTKDGSLFFANGLLFPLMDEKNELIGFVKILRDLTERKIAEEAIKKQMKELEELNTHKENILAILSHDLRSPLSTIIGITDYLNSAIDEMELSEIKKMHVLLHQASTDELNMLDYLLEWARIKYASEVFSPAFLDLEQSVSKVFDTINEQAVAKSISLHNKVEEGTRVFADKKMVHSILQNLGTNAIKFTNPGGSITISASANDDKVLVSVKDTGIGMSKETMYKLFKPQIKTLAQARKEDKGAGIGLLLVKGFVERNEGEIWAESVEGQGSTFYFTLPYNPPPETPVSSDNLGFSEEEEEEEEEE